MSRDRPEADAPAGHPYALEIGAERDGWYELVALVRSLTPDEWQSRTADYESHSYIDRNRMQAMVLDLVADVPDVSAAPLFTDDYAPIETMPF